MMEQQTIEGNKLIAEFDGWYQKERTTPAIYSLENPYYRNNDKEAASIYGFKYHESWDWLMPVVEKIMNYKYEDGDTAFPRTFGMQNANNHKIMVRLNRSGVFEADTLIEAVWFAVIDFIKWYNLKKK